MALTKEQKAAAIEEIVGLIEGVPTLYLTDYAGLDVTQTNELRNRFRAQGIEYKVVKNTLLKLAMERLGGYEALYEDLRGPIAVAFGEEPAAPARVMKRFTEENKTEAPSLKAAFVDGAAYPAGSLEALAALKSKTELLGDIIGLLNAPLPNIISALQAQGSTLVGAIKTISEREA